MNKTMKKITILLFTICSTVVSAQSFDFNYDHYSVIVKDLDKVGDFYKNVLNLKEIPHPSAPSGFKWFVIQGNSQLHLIGKDSVAMQHSKSVHLCLATQKLDELWLSISISIT